MGWRYFSVAVLLFYAGAVHGIAWRHASDAMRPYVWNTTGAILIVVLALLVLNAYRSLWVAMTCIMIATYSTRVAWCSISWMLSPWPIVPGEELCSDRLGAFMTTLGALALLAVGLLMLDRRRE